jgi:hypothetical protein
MVSKREYFTVKSDLPAVYDDNPPPTPTNNEKNAGPVAQALLPPWFTNAPSEFKKKIRVLGVTAMWVKDLTDAGDLVPLDPDYRVFSNISTRSNLVMNTVMHMGPKVTPTIGREGFVMMANNYNSEKDFDVTYENLTDVKFYVRPWNSYTGWLHPIDFVCESEIIIYTT